MGYACSKSLCVKLLPGMKHSQRICYTIALIYRCFEEQLKQIARQEKERLYP